jgi:prolyl-tRNA synthetase
LIYLADGKLAMVLMRGDDQVNETKLGGVLGTMTFRPANPDEIFQALKAHPGSLGAIGVTSMPVYADELLRGVCGMTTGANEDGFHYRNVSIDRDIKVTRWASLRTVKVGEPCSACGQALKIRRAIEVGHVFKLGTKYSKALNALYSDENGQQQPTVMGCYGIGVTRTMQAVIEQNNDKDGIFWPVSVAPFVVCITPLNIVPGGPVMTLAETIYNGLTSQGVDVLLDDRDERPGVKFKDSELIGIPLRIAIGEKSLAKGVVEIKPRGGVLITVKPEEAVSKALEWIKEEQQKLTPA